MGLQSSRTEGRVIAKLTSSSCLSLLGAHSLRQICLTRWSQLVCVLFSIIAVGYMWLLSTLNIADATEYMNYDP